MIGSLQTKKNDRLIALDFAYVEVNHSNRYGFGLQHSVESLSIDSISIFISPDNSFTSLRIFLTE